jgi:prepilin-type N-terminal cleavage/methylation domain-containing protein
MSVPAPLNRPARSGNSPHSRGFTLVEILVALVIIAILSAVSFPLYNRYIDKAKVTLAISTLEAVRRVMEIYHVDHGTYPASIDFATGKDDQGRTVLEGAQVDEIKRNILTVVSYTGGASTYTVNARAKDSSHTTLVLTPGQVVTQVP